jgi:hypothetical protein
VIFVAVCIWIVFCIRDYCLLRTGATNDFRSHARWYGASILVTAALVCLALLLAGPARVRDIAISTLVLEAAIACHLLVTAACVWLSRSGSQASSSWVLVLVPVPASWIFLVTTATTLHAGSDGTEAAGFVFAIAAAWMILTAAAARPDHRETVPADDLDFSVRFAGWSNCMACCLVPLFMQ